MGLSSKITKPRPQGFSAPLSLTLLELQIYIGWRYTRLAATELPNRVIDSRRNFSCEPTFRTLNWHIDNNAIPQHNK